MQNLICSSPGQGCPLEEGVNPMTVHQGDCVNLDSDDDTYQVIGVDGDPRPLLGAPLAPAEQRGLTGVRNLVGKDSPGRVSPC